MEFKSAEEQKVFRAEKKISVIRAVVIVFSSTTFFALENPAVYHQLAHVLIILTAIYGGFVLLYRPYETYPVFHTAWFTYTSDGVFVTLWVFATGGFYSPYWVIYYASIIAVGFRFGMRTTFFTAALYVVLYWLLLQVLGHVDGNETTLTVRSGFFLIVGWLTGEITGESLVQARQRYLMKELMEEAQRNHEQLQGQQRRLNRLNAELRLKNHLFSHAEENAMIGSFAFYLQKERIEFSANMFRMLGLKPYSISPTIETYLACVHPGDRENVRAWMKAAISDRKIPPGVHRIVRGDASVRSFRFTGRWLRSGGEDVLLGTLQDVTSDVSMHQALKRKNIDLARTNQELSGFNYVATHDLKEPVRKIITFADLITGKYGKDVQPGLRDYLDRIQAAARRMQHLIEAFLSYSAIASSPKVESVDVSELVNEAERRVHDVYPGVEIKIWLRGKAQLAGDRIQLCQLFYHLLDNAVKYRKPGQPAVIDVSVDQVIAQKISRVKNAGDRHYWKISVADNGMGFEQRYAERIFDIFQKLHHGEDFKGTGMGLAICRKVVMNHRGVIEAHGNPGVGAVFVVYFPQQ